MERIRPVLALILVNVLFGTGYPFVKTVVQYLEPSTWVFVRASLSTLILFGLCLRNGYSLKLRKMGWLFLASLLGIAINQLCFAEGISRTIPAHASMINATVPLQTLLYGAFFLKERLTGGKVVGVILGFSGVVWLLQIDRIGFFNPFLTGDLLTLANAVSYSFYLIVARKALADVSPLLALTVMSVFGSLMVGAYTGWPFPASSIAAFPPKIWLFMLYLILVPTIVTYALNLWALKRVEASHAGLYVYLQPVVATVLSYFMLHDIPSARFYVSAGLVFAGLVVGSWKQSSKLQSAPIRV